MDVRVNKDEWEALDGATRAKITEVLAGFFKGSKIVPDPKAERFKDAAALGNPFCEAACTIAENAAKVACLNLPNPIAIAACIAAAEAAGRECRRHC